MLKNLKKLRREKGISQQQLGTILGVSQQSINKYENHSVEPDISTLIAIADYFDTTIDCLVGRQECEKLDFSQSYELTKAESDLIRDYRQLDDVERVCIDTLVRTYKKMKTK